MNQFQGSVRNSLRSESPSKRSLSGLHKEFSDVEADNACGLVDDNESLKPKGLWLAPRQGSRIDHLSHWSSGKAGKATQEGRLGSIQGYWAFVGLVGKTWLPFPRR